MPKQVVIADDHPVFRAGLRRIIEDAGYTVISEVGDGDSCIASLDILRPDIVTLDLALPGRDGYSVLQWIGEHQREIMVIVISMHSAASFAQQARKLGARAFVAKEDAANEIENAFRTPQGVFYMSASVGRDQKVTEPMPNQEESERAAERLQTLTQAERRVFDLVAKSFTSRQIGERLGLSHRTIQTHRQRINEKLGLKGPNSLLQFALRNRRESI